MVNQVSHVGAGIPRTAEIRPEEKNGAVKTEELAVQPGARQDVYVPGGQELKRLTISLSRQGQKFCGFRSTAMLRLILTLGLPLGCVTGAPFCHVSGLFPIALYRVYSILRVS